MTRSPPTSLDVAKAAGVSQSVVSRVFTQKGRVSAASIAKVRAAAAELGYRPNVLARSLINGRSKIVGLVMGNLHNPFYVDAIEKLSPALQDVGLHLMVFMQPHNDSSIENVIAGILDYKVEGMVMAAAALPDGLAERCSAEGLPVVFFGRGSDNAAFDSVTTDGVEGARLAVRHLVAGGRRRIAHIAGLRTSSSAIERRAGYEAELAASGLASGGIFDGGYSRKGAEAATRALLDRSDPPDAIFVSNDMMAFAVMDVLRSERGLRIPEDIAVVGFDDVRFAGWPTYDLTTIRQDTARMVDATVELLGRTDRAPTPNGRATRLPPVLVARGSSGPPAPEI